VSTEALVNPVPTPDAKAPTWQKAVKPYQHADLRRSLWQMLNSIAPYFIFSYLAYRALEVSYLLTLVFVVLAAGFVVRCFIIFHDCGHGSFFKSRKANDFVGTLMGFITYTPYFAWRHAHAIHHSTSGDLDHRGIGDVWTLTYEEYQKMGLLGKIGYRVYRNPLMTFFVGPTLEFVFINRLPNVNTSDKARDKNSVHWTSLVVFLNMVVIGWAIGLDNYLKVQIPIIAITSSIGVWLFYVQHQFENTYWERHENWDFADAAMQGSSYYKLPKIFQWFSGNIGFHHIHHLSPRIPNYKLEECHTENEIFQEVVVLTWATSLKSLRLRLWDENHGKMIGYHHDHEHAHDDKEEMEITSMSSAAV